MNENSAPMDEVFISINLEASLGKIDDSVPTEGLCDAMDCDDGESPVTVSPSTTKRIRTTRTRPRFYSQSCDNESKEHHHIISPYPLSETEVEIEEREKLTETVGYNWSIDEEDNNNKKVKTTTMLDDDDDMMPMTPSDGWRNSFNIAVIPADDSKNDDEDCDDFSLSSHEAGSLLAEDATLDNITEDPTSFWEEGTMAVSTTEQQQQKPCSIPTHVSFGSL